MRKSKGKGKAAAPRTDWTQAYRLGQVEGYSLEWAAFGGISKKDLAESCRALGIPFRWCYTIYVGQYGVEILKRDKTKFEKEVIHWS